MSFFARTTGVNPINRRAIDLGSLDDLILNDPYLVGFHDFDPDRVSLGTDMALLNRVAGGPAFQEVTALSGMVLTTDNLPPGGQIRQAGFFDANASLKATGLLGTGSTNRFTKAIMFRPAIKSQAGSTTSFAGGPSGGTNNHSMIIGAGSTVTASIGTTGSTAVVQQRVPNGAWSYIIQSWNAPSNVITMSCERQAVTTDTGTAQVNNQADMYLGGNAGAASYLGWMGCVLTWSAANNGADLFHASMTAKLELVRTFLDAKCGRHALAL